MTHHLLKSKCNFRSHTLLEQRTKGIKRKGLVFFARGKALLQGIAFHSATSVVVSFLHVW